MKTLVYKDQFINDLTKTDNFTYKGASALYDWFEDWNMSDVEIVYDPVQIRCEWTEYTSISEFMSDYDTDDWQVNNIEDFFEILAEHTLVCKIDNHHFIIENY